MTAPANQSMPDISYKLVPVVPENAGEDFQPNLFEITRTDKDSTLVVAIIDKTTNHLEFASQDTLKFRVPTLRFLNDESVAYKTMSVKGTKRDRIRDDEPPVPVPPPCKQGSPGYPAYVQYLRDGDKYQPIVEWFKRYRPNEYALRYGVIGEGEVTVQEGFDTDQKTGKKTPRYRTKTALLASRKIHDTEKPEANDAPASFSV